jgi:hypothetical protein
MAAIICRKLLAKKVGATASFYRPLSAGRNYGVRWPSRIQALVSSN